MQQIERYGVIALLLLLVTVLAVSMWGDGDAVADPSTPTLASAPAARNETPKQRPPVVRPPRERTEPARTTRLRDGLDLSQPETDPSLRVTPTPGGLRPASVQDRNRRAADRSAANRTQPASSSLPTEPVRRRDPAPVHEDTPAAALARAVEPAPTPEPASKPAARPAPREDRQAPRPVPAATPPRTWTVKSGDTLSEIAQATLGSAGAWRRIAEANPGVDPNRLPVGRELVLPTGAASSASAAATPASDPKALLSRPAAGATKAGGYVVRSGDMLSTISQRELGTAQRWREIVALNPGIDPDRLVVGARLVLPAPSADAPVREATSSRVAAADAPSRSTKRGRVR